MLHRDEMISLADLAATDDELNALDTGQILDTGQWAGEDHDLFTGAADDGAQLGVAFHEVHRKDEAEGGGQELVISTLKFFQLHIAVQDAAGAMLFHLDGMSLVATPVYEDGSVVEEKSATLEPPLLSPGGQVPPRATVEGGCAIFRLRLTVLSSLCAKRAFAIRIHAEGRPELCVTTAAVKTITKLHRAPRDGAKEKPKRASGDAELALLPPAATKKGKAATLGCELLTSDALGRAASNLGCGGGEGRGAFAECAGPWAGRAPLGPPSLDALWDEVSANGSRLLQLQAQQRSLFRELRELQGPMAQMHAATGGAIGV